jgi:hypothetical protein
MDWSFLAQLFKSATAFRLPNMITDWVKIMRNDVEPVRKKERQALTLTPDNSTGTTIPIPRILNQGAE